MRDYIESQKKTDAASYGARASRVWDHLLEACDENWEDTAILGNKSIDPTPYADSSGNPSVRLSRPNVINNESGFNLNRSTDGGPFTQLKQQGVGSSRKLCPRANA